MEKFGNVLHDILINKPTYSISAFAKDIGISAGLLNHIFNGKRTIASDKFMLTLRNSAFDSRELKNLKDAYFSDRYGDALYMKVRIFHEALQSADFNEDFTLPEIVTDFSQETTVLDSKVQIVNAMHRLFDDADKCIYTNIPYGKDEINSILYSLKMKYNKKCLSRFITKTDTDFSKESLLALFSMIHFAGIGVSAVTTESDRDFIPDGSALFPYFIISDKGIILFDDKYTMGICVLSEKFVNEKYKETIRRYNVCEKAVIFFSNEMEISSYMLTDTGKELNMLQFMPMFLAQDDLSYLMDVFTEELAFKHEAMMLLSKHSANKTYNVYTSIDGLAKFLKTGKSFITSENFVGRFSDKEKVGYLESLLDTINNSKNFRHYFYNLRFNFSEFAQRLSFRVDDSKLSVYSMMLPEDENSFMGQIAVFIGNNDMYRVISTYIKDYLPVCGELISTESAYNCISSMLLDCKCRSKDKD